PWRCRPLFRRQHHDDLSAFEAGLGFDFGDLDRVAFHPLEQLLAQFLMRHLAAAEPKGYLDLVALIEEAPDRLHLHVVIVIVDHGAHLDLLDLDDLLLLAGFGGLLLLLIFELAVIENLAHRRLGIGRQFDEIETGFLGQRQGLAGRYNAAVLSLLVDEADFSSLDAVIDSVSFFLGGGRSATSHGLPGGYAQVCGFSVDSPAGSALPKRGGLRQGVVTKGGIDRDYGRQVKADAELK